MQEEESFIEAYLMELEAEKEAELEEDNEVFENSETVEKSEVEEVPKSEEETEDKLEFEIEEEPESKEGLEELNLLPARGTCRRKPLRNCYREEKGVQRNSWRKEKCKWRLS